MEFITRTFYKVTYNKFYHLESDEFEMRNENFVCFLLIVLLDCLMVELDDKKADENHIVFHDGYHLVSRQVLTDISEYKSYATVKIVTYLIMKDVTEALFSFDSEDQHLNKNANCSRKTVIVNLKYGAYPLVNPDGYPFPKAIISPSKREKFHTLKFPSDVKNKVYSIKYPKPGNWYALIYKEWSAPKAKSMVFNPFSRSLLFGHMASCRTVIYTNLQVKREKSIELINCYKNVIIDYAQLPTIFKCLLLDSLEPITLKLIIRNTSPANAEIYFRAEALSVPTENNSILYCIFDPKVNNAPVITFVPHPAAWHYLQLGIVNDDDNVSDPVDCASYLYSDFDKFGNHTISDLIRNDKTNIFDFDYMLPSKDLNSTTSLIYLKSTEIKTFRFELSEFKDIGGSLLVAASFKINLKLRYFMEYKRVFPTKSLTVMVPDVQFLRVVICMDIGHPSIPLYSGECKYNDKVNPALFVLNNSDSESIYEKTYIPYPDKGIWYLTLKLFCDDAVCRCKAKKANSAHLVRTYDEIDDSNASSSKGNDNEVNTTTPFNEANISTIISSEGDDIEVGTSECKTNIMLKVSSKACLNGQCHKHGFCRLSSYNEIPISYCVCSSGFGGWDCSDGTKPLHHFSTKSLTAVLLLTLSNLFFGISIYVAILRSYYEEATMYAFTLFFSTFYHACDDDIDWWKWQQSDSVITLCIIPRKILQFGDFYCGIMCFWVTLLAISIIGHVLKSMLQLTGGVVVALLTFWNMHSIVTFLVPTGVGGGLLITSWLLDFKRNGQWKYSKTYYFRDLPIGIILVIIGSTFFVVLQNEHNYHIIHSLWHVLIALCLVFLLPKKT